MSARVKFVMLKSLVGLAESQGPKTLSRQKGTYVAPGGRSAVPRRVPRKLKIGDTRPAIYYKFDQTIELSDGSTVKRRSTFPRLEWKYISDQRNNPLWNPSKPNLRAIELDASGRLAKFKKKFSGFESAEPSADGSETSGDAFDIDSLISSDAQQVTTGRLHQAKKPLKKKK